MEEDTKREPESASEGETPPIMQVPHIYFNVVNVGCSAYEFQLIMGESTADTLTQGERAYVKPLLIAKTSPQHLKAMVKVMTKKIENYENQFGTIPERPESRSEA